MIELIDINLKEYLKLRALTIDGCYLAGVNSLEIKSVLLNGEETLGVMYCDVNNGFAIITTKCDRNGVTHGMFFGKVEVVLEDWA